MARVTASEFEENPPDPTATIEALRSLGYSKEAAIADLIDNSVAAGARNVGVKMRWEENSSWCSVLDDGVGMSEDGLRQAMRIGAKDPLQDRGEADLGRFGMGLKTASFSQAREMTVATRRLHHGPLFTRTWDLDHVRATGRWQMARTPQPPVERVISTELGQRVGTVVVWRRLTRTLDSIVETDVETAHNDFTRTAEAMAWHLGMTFGRMLADGLLRITLNSQLVEPWDPFERANSFTQELAEEVLEFKGHRIVVRGFVLPHLSKLSEAERARAAGPLGWNNHQGFYVYRRNRLIAPGAWLSTGHTRGDSFNLARLSVDVPPELDHAWGLDVKKTSVIPPPAILRDLKRIAEVTRNRAKRVHTSRSVELIPRQGSASTDTVWRQRRSNTEIRFRISRSHPLVETVLRESGAMRRTVESLLRVIEETIPIPYLPASKVSERIPLDGESVEQLYQAAEKVYEALLAKHPTRDQAIEHLRRTEPFDSHPDIIERILET